MCRLFIVYSKNPEVTKLVTLALAVFSKEKGNDDGYFAMVSEDIGLQGEVIRTLDWKEYIEFLKTREYRIAFCHLRLASSGSIDLDNVHGFPVKVKDLNYRLAMNGHYSPYYTYSYRYYRGYDDDDSGKCDTAILAEHIDRYSDVVKGFEEFRSQRYGSAVTYIVAEDFIDMYIIDDGHHSTLCEVYIKKPVKGKAYVLSSQEDIIADLEKTKTIEICDYERRERKLWFIDVVSIAKRVIERFEISAVVTECVDIGNGIYYVDLIAETYDILKKLNTYTGYTYK